MNLLLKFIYNHNYLQTRTNKDYLQNILKMPSYGKAPGLAWK